MNAQKIVLLGDSQVGKTTFVKLLNGENFVNSYTPTLGVEVTPIRKGTQCFNIWDCSGNPNYRGLGDGYYIQADGAIIMCDATKPASFANLQNWSNEFKRIVGNEVPIVLAITKSEHLPYDFDTRNYVCISCANNTNLNNVLNFFE